MNALWILVGASLWLALAVAIGIPTGRVIRARDQQVPRTPRKDPK